MSDLHLERWTPELRRAVLRVCPDFFAWPVGRRLRYGVALPEADRAEICSYLLDHLLPDEARASSAAVDEDRPFSLVQNRCWPVASSEPKRSTARSFDRSVRSRLRGADGLIGQYG